MKAPSATAYGDAPLGVECAFPGETPRLAQPGRIGTSLWRRVVYRIRYGVKVAPANRSCRTI